MNKKLITVIAVVALAVGLAVGYLVFHSSPKALVGAVGVKLAEQYDPYIKYNGGYNSALPIQTTGGTNFTGGSVIGSSGSTINNVIFGTCTVFTKLATTITATTSSVYDCDNNSTAGTNVEAPISGVQAGDMIVINNASTTGAYAALSGLDTIGVVASSTNGYISILFSNTVGGTFTWPVTASTTINFIDLR